MIKNKNDYPYWVYNSKREWLQTARKQWSGFKRSFKKTEVRTGSAFYPDEVYQWLKRFDEMDKKMKEFYKNA